MPRPLLHAFATTLISSVLLGSGGTLGGNGRVGSTTVNGGRIGPGNSIGRLLVEFQKYELGRARPELNPHLVTVYTLSFPSAHSANAVMTYVAMALLLTRPGSERLRWTIAAAILALLIGLSRIILGVHYPSDVVAGWSFGTLWCLVMLWFAKRVVKPVRVEGGVQ